MLGTKTRRRNHQGLTLVEIVLSLGLLLIIIAGFTALSNISLLSTRNAQPSLVAQEAAMRLVERMRAHDVPGALDQYWDNAAVVKVPISPWTPTGPGPGTPALYAVDGPGIQPIMAGFGAAQGDGLQQYYERRLMGPPLDGQPPLRVRFLTEEEYMKLWSLPANLCDLNFDGTGGVDADGEVQGADTAAWPTAPSYRMFPVLVEVHWSEQGTARRYQLKTILTQQELTQ